ncbi:MAG TPA: lysophospholipid acyltransferase family protein, partial [Bacilli bacterium]|nr:lysophospholipid acyltransferase family protein [Bacilli bacterium]
MWTKFRHKVVFAIVRPFFWVFLRLRFGFRAKPFKLPKKPVLILFNHQTSLDPFMVALSFKGPIYFLATDDIFSLRFWSPLIRFLVAPIPKSKSFRDFQAIKNIITVAAEGGVISLAPEGNRTYSGRLCHIDYAIVKLIKHLKIPVCLYTFKHGYGISPRFSPFIRKGKMTGEVAKYLDEDTINRLSNDELYQEIVSTLSIDEFSSKQLFKSSHRAEYLERAVFFCPVCRRIGTLHSHKDMLHCTYCHLEVTYQENLSLTANNQLFKFTYLWEWMEFEKDYLLELDLSENRTLFKDEKVTLKEVIKNRRKKKLLKGQMMMDFENIKVTDGEKTLMFPLDDIISMAVMGQNKLNIYFGKAIFQIKAHPRFNALKYMQLYFHIKNKKKGVTDG